MMAIDMIVPPARMPLWHRVLAERLTRAGHDVALRNGPVGTGQSASIAALLGFERLLLRGRVSGLAEPVANANLSEPTRPANLVIDLVGRYSETGRPVLRVAIDGTNSPDAAITALAAGTLPRIEIALDGRIVASAHPMIDRPEFLTLAADDLLARTITLVVHVVERFAKNGSQALEAIPASPPAAERAEPALLARYLAHSLPRIGREAWRRLGYRSAHWRVGFRFTDGDGVGETGRLGNGWTVLPDDGTHFYADPFPFHAGGRDHIFVEDYPHATGKAVIAHVALDAHGRPSRPEPVLEEPHHLSYPHVFSRDGEIWMLPEASASGRLTLYRAGRFPDRWIPETVLIEGREISDATLLDHGNRLWLFATERDGYGSTSDTLVVFHAGKLSGPWMAHPANPIVVDRRRARPGGAFIRSRSGLLLPVQDGTRGYGGGLGLARLKRLDTGAVVLSDPVAIAAGGDWPYPQIHTLNRIGRLEVIDGIAAVRKRPARQRRETPLHQGTVRP